MTLLVEDMDTASKSLGYSLRYLRHAAEIMERNGMVTTTFELLNTIKDIELSIQQLDKFVSEKNQEAQDGNSRQVNPEILR